MYECEQVCLLVLLALIPLSTIIQPHPHTPLSGKLYLLSQANCTSSLPNCTSSLRQTVNTAPKLIRQTYGKRELKNAHLHDLVELGLHLKVWPVDRQNRHADFKRQTKQTCRLKKHTDKTDMWIK